MGPVIFFILGLVGGMQIEKRIDEYKDHRIEVLERLVEMDKADPAYYYKDPMGQVWALGPGFCEQVL